MKDENVNKEKLLMTTKGRDEILNDLEQARMEYYALLSGRCEVKKLDTTTTLLGQENEERKLLSKISLLLDTLNRVEIIPEPTIAEEDADIVKIGDVLSIAISSNGKRNEMSIGLVEYVTDTIPGITKVSTASALGKAIKGQRVGTTVSYDAPIGKVDVIILAKLSLEERIKPSR